MEEAQQMPDSERQDIENEAQLEAEGGAAAADTRLAAIIESLLFAAGEPMTLRRLAEILNGPSPAEVRAALDEVARGCEAEGRGVRLVEVAGGYQLRTSRENAEWVKAIFRERPRRLGRAALETLAVIAYRQPITRAEVEAIRGVDIDAVLNTLLQRNLVRVSGRKETVGRPLLYATSENFLEIFGLRDLNELPTLKEISATPEETEEQKNEQSQTEPAGDTPAEAAEPGGDLLEAEGGGADPRGEGAGERADDLGAGDESGSDPRSD